MGGKAVFILACLFFSPLVVKRNLRKTEKMNPIKWFLCLYKEYIVLLYIALKNDPFGEFRKRNLNLRRGVT